MTPKTSPEGHDRRDVPGSCRARSPALHVGGRDRVASWSWSRTSHPHAHLHAQLGLISASAAPSAVIYHRHAHALEELVARRFCRRVGWPCERCSSVFRQDGVKLSAPGVGSATAAVCKLQKLRVCSTAHLQRDGPLPRHARVWIVLRRELVWRQPRLRGPRLQLHRHARLLHRRVLHGARSVLRWPRPGAVQPSHGPARPAGGRARWHV